MIHLNHPTSPPIATFEPVWRFTVEQYHQMIDCGVLAEDAPVELLSGCLIQKMTKNPPHRLCTRLVREALDAIVPNGWYVETQEPITLSDSEPEPDLAIIQGNPRDYPDRHPNATEVALIIEVADSTLERDRTIKQTIYAAAGIPEYWIVNVRDRQIEIYRSPFQNNENYRYQKRLIVTQGTIEVILNDQPIGSILVNDCFPLL